MSPVASEVRDITADVMEPNVELPDTMRLVVDAVPETVKAVVDAYGKVDAVVVVAVK